MLHPEILVFFPPAAVFSQLCGTLSLFPACHTPLKGTGPPASDAKRNTTKPIKYVNVSEGV